MEGEREVKGRRTDIPSFILMRKLTVREGWPFQPSSSTGKRRSAASELFVRRMTSLISSKHSFPVTSSSSYFSLILAIKRVLCSYEH